MSEANCPMIGVGGHHSDSYGDDGDGACEWCGARPPKHEHEYVQYSVKPECSVDGLAHAGAPCCKHCGGLMEDLDPKRFAEWWEQNKHRYKEVKRDDC